MAGTPIDHTALKEQLIAAYEGTDAESFREFFRLTRIAHEVLSQEELAALGAYFTVSLAAEYVDLKQTLKD